MKKGKTTFIWQFDILLHNAETECGHDKEQLLREILYVLKNRNYPDPTDLPVESEPPRKTYA